jgi:hypothetical protein
MLLTCIYKCLSLLSERNNHVTLFWCKAMSAFLPRDADRTAVPCISNQREGNVMIRTYELWNISTCTVLQGISRGTDAPLKVNARPLSASCFRSPAMIVHASASSMHARLGPSRVTTAAPRPRPPPIATLRRRASAHPPSPACASPHCRSAQHHGEALYHAASRIEGVRGEITTIVPHLVSLPALDLLRFMPLPLIYSSNTHNCGRDWMTKLPPRSRGGGPCCSSSVAYPRRYHRRQCAGRRPADPCPAAEVSALLTDTSQTYL